MKFTTVGPLERTLEVASDDAGVEFFIDDSDCHGGTDHFRLSPAEAERLAVELAQETMSALDRDDQFEVGNCECGDVALQPAHAHPMAKRDDPFILERDEAIRIGLALIRAARAAKEAK